MTSIVVAIFKTRSEALIQECYDVFSVDNLFHAFADAGKKLADLSVNCESAKEFPLTRQENIKVPLNWRVAALKLGND